MSEELEQDQVDNETLSVSEVLVSAREKTGLSQKDVADQLYLTSTFIRYIDEGQFQKIPKPAFIKGYLRSYARVVNLKGDEIVDLYQAGLESDQQVDIRDVTEERVGSASFTGPVVQTGVVGLAAILIVIALVWVFTDETEDPAAPVAASPQPAKQDRAAFRTMEDQPLTVAQVTSQTETDLTPTQTDPMEAAEMSATGSGDEPIDPESGADPEAAVISEFESVDSSRDVVPEESVSNDPADDPEQVAAESETAESAEEQARYTVEKSENGEFSYITVDTGGFDELELTMSDECWIEITDAAGKGIYGDLNREGDVLTVHGTAPFEILLGRASAVSLRFNQESIDLARYTTADRTAKLELGAP